MNYNRQLQYSFAQIFLLYSVLFCILFRIWGSFGQKLLENTNFLIICPKSMYDSAFLTRTIDLLKLSGAKLFEFYDSFEDFKDFNRKNPNVLLIIDQEIYKDSQIDSSTSDCPCVIFQNFTFKLKFSSRLCTPLKNLLNIFILKIISFYKYVVIDPNIKDLSLEELLEITKSISHLAKEPRFITNFCEELNNFINKTNRFPILPQDFKCLDNLNIDSGDLIYLIENCRKFRLIQQSNDFIDSSSDTKQHNHNHSIIDEFMTSALLAVEIQKIVTRKYVPELFELTFINGEINRK